MKKIVALLLALFWALPVMAAPPEEASVAMVQTIWQAQTIDGLKDGVWVIPEAVLNDYFVAQADGDKLKNPVLKLLGDNKLYVAFDSSMGRVGLTCEVKEFVHNQTQSYAEVYIRKKEVAGKPFVSWMLKFIPMGALADLYGNPMKDMKQVDAKFAGNTLKINFRPLVEKSLLNTELGREVEISGMAIHEGALELHTNMRPAQLLKFLAKQKGLF
ncbi:MAG: hypothetical protein H6Q74_3115 [Firmicutes bacterium]|nr:hypothetical protein [Bacillota bacterium]